MVGVAGMKVGDWVYCEFELGQIKRMEDGRITEFTDGAFSHSSFNLTDRCFPLSIGIKLISDEYACWSTRLHREGSNVLNYPDIHRWLVAHWVETCTTPEDKDFIKRRYHALATFCKDVLDKHEIA